MQEIRMQTLEELQVLILGQVGYVWLLHSPLQLRHWMCQGIYWMRDSQPQQSFLASPYVNFGCDYCKVTYHRLADALEHEKSCKEQARSKRHFPFLAKDAFKKRLKVSCDRTITLIELEKSKK